MSMVNRTFSSLSVWRLLVGAFLLFAELHYLLVPASRGVWMATPAEKSFNMVGQVAISAISVWLLWSAFRPSPGRCRWLPDTSVVLFSAGAVAQAIFLFTPPVPTAIAFIETPGIQLGFSLSEIGAPSGGWEWAWATAPFPYHAAFFAAPICVAGVTVMFVGQLIGWAVRRVRS